jgi:hypothetical protein
VSCTILCLQSEGQVKRSQICDKMLVPCAVRSIMHKQVTLQLPLPGSNITDVKLKVRGLSVP